MRILSLALVAVALSPLLDAQPSVVRNNACAAASASGTAYTCTIPNVASFAYVDGAHYWLRADVLNTGAVTFAFNGAAAVPVTKPTSGIMTALAGGDIQPGQWVEVIYDVAHSILQMQSLLGNGSSGSGGGAAYAENSFTSTTSGCPSGISNCIVVTHGLNTLTPVCTVEDAFHCVFGSTGGTCGATTLLLAQASSSTTYTYGFSATTSGTWACIGPPAGAIPLPSILPAAGTYSSTQTVTLSDVNGSATLCYTLDGTTPTATTPGTCSHGTTYTGSFAVSANTTVKAIGTLTGVVNSGVLTAVYTISTTTATPTNSPGAGTYTTSQTVTLSDATAGALICYTTNGSTPTAATAGTCDTGGGISTYTGPFTLSATATVNAIGTFSGLTNSSLMTAAYTIQAAMPTSSPAAGTYSTTQTVTLSDATPGALICYTLDLSTPTATTPGTCSHGATYSGGFSVSATTTVMAIATLTGLTNSAVLTSLYTISTTVATAASKLLQSSNGMEWNGMEWNPAEAGTYTSSQAVTLTDSSGGALICYTTNGNTPTASVAGTCDTGSGISTYTSPFTLTTSATVKAIGTESGLTNSSLMTAAYTIQAATPTSSPGAGTYTSSQAVTLSDATSGALICYTTNGSTPTATTPGTCDTGGGISTYSSPFTLTASATVNAIATKTGLANSAALTAAYTIQVATPTTSPGAGTYTSTQTVTLSDATSGAVICYTTDGTTPTATTPGTCLHGTTYSGSFNVATTTTVEAIGTEAGMTNSSLLTAVYTITPPAGVTAVDSTFFNTATGLTTMTTASGGGHLLTLQSGDQLHLYAYSTATSCSGTPFTFTDSASDTFAPVTGSSCTVNQWTGSGIQQEFTVLSTAAASSVSIQLVVASNGSIGGFNVTQMRGTANAQPDAVGSCDSNTSGNNCAGVAYQSGSTPLNIGTPNASAASSAYLVIANMFTSNGVTFTPTTNGCFGVTGTTPSFAPSGTTESAVQYASITGAATSSCTFQISSTSPRMLKMAAYH